MKAKFVYESVFAPKTEEEILTSIKELSHYQKTEMLKTAIRNEDKPLIKKLLKFINVKEFNVDIRNYDYEQFNPDHFHLTLLKLLTRDKSGQILKIFIDNGFIPLTIKLDVNWEIRKELEEILRDNLEHEELIKLLNERLYNELLNEKVKVLFDQHFRKNDYSEFTQKELLDMVNKQIKYVFDTLKISPMLNLQIRDSRQMDPVLWTSDHDHKTWEIYSEPIILNGFEAKRLHSNFEKLANSENEGKRWKKEKFVYLKVNNYILRRRDEGLYFDMGSSFDRTKLNLLHL
jgi:hypothetical protein